MQLNYKNNFIGYFKFYYHIVGVRLLIYLLLSILISFMDGLGLAMFIPLLQFVNKGSPKDVTPESQGQIKHILDLIQWFGLELNITSVLLFLVSLFVFKGIFRYCQLRYHSKIREFFIKKVRYELVNNLQGLSYSAFLKLDAGKVQNTLTTEVLRLLSTMSAYFNAAQTSVMLITYIVLAVFANYQFALLVGVGALLSNFIYRRIYLIVKKTSNELSENSSDFNSLLIQSVYYFKYLKSTNRFSKYADRLRGVIDQTETLWKKIGALNAISGSMKEPLIIIIVCSVIMFQMNFMGSSLNSILLSLLLFYRALGFLVTVQNYWQNFIENSGGMDAVVNMLKQMSGAQEKTGDKLFMEIKDEIQFSNVEFFYDRKKALDNVSICIPRKKTIALVGESGSGKTTIANMIAGLIKPNNGKINIDDISIEQYSLNSYRDKIGYISQEPVIFNDTIFNNITFWDETTPGNMLRFKEAIRMASLESFLLTQPDKEQTKLGDNGILISGGQKQRISIARELYKKTELLILDEATSALDSETEKIIQENIANLHGSYTMVVIAHRLSTIKEADIIYLIDNGRVSASGSFEEMMLKSSRFKKMVNLQTV